MAVYELIEELKKYPHDMRVVAPGYEGGCDDITGTVKTAVEFDINPEEWYGRHDDKNDPASVEKNPPEQTASAEAVMLKSNRRM